MQTEVVTAILLEDKPRKYFNAAEQCLENIAALTCRSIV
jgi:hypothetical protein